VATLTSQNRDIVAELESHIHTNETVRQQLDRKREVDVLKDTMNRDLMASRMNLERLSPSKYAVDATGSGLFRES